MTRYFPKLDDTWRLVQRGVPQYIDPSIDARDCYVFQRHSDEVHWGFTTHVIPVDQFWHGKTETPSASYCLGCGGNFPHGHQCGRKAKR